MDSIITKETLNKYTWYYISEVFEAMIALTIYRMLTVKDHFNFLLILKGSLIIGAITTFLENYNPTYSKSVKSGAMVAIGSNLVKNV
jgi:hypothetical protein